MRADPPTFALSGAAYSPAVGAIIAGRVARDAPALNGLRVDETANSSAFVRAADEISSPAVSVRGMCLENLACSPLVVSRCKSAACGCEAILSIKACYSSRQDQVHDRGQAGVAAIKRRRTTRPAFTDHDAEGTSLFGLA
jgi:hypothetical protein